jgi:predicted dehydrogenase
LQRGAFMAVGAEIEAFVDVDAEKARQAAREYRVPRHFASLEEAVRSCRPDFVSVCTSASSHLEVASAAMKAGCHVLVEKPMTSTLAEAEQLSSVAAQTGRTLCVVHNHKFYPGIVRAMEIVKSGEIGTVTQVHRTMSFCHDRVRMMEPEHWAHRIPGGRLFEANPHNLYLAYAFVGKMQLQHITARNTSGRWPHVMIDEFSATLTTPHALVQITMSLNLESSSRQPKHGANFLIIVGTRASLLVTYHSCEFLDALAKGVTPAASPLPVNSRFRQLRARLRRSVWLPSACVDSEVRALHTPESTVFNDGVSSGHRYVIDRFVGYLEGRFPDPPTSIEEAIETQRLNGEMGLAAEKSHPLSEHSQPGPGCGVGSPQSLP